MSSYEPSRQPLIVVTYTFLNFIHKWTQNDVMFRHEKKKNLNLKIKTTLELKQIM